MLKCRLPQKALMNIRYILGTCRLVNARLYGKQQRNVFSLERVKRIILSDVLQLLKMTCRCYVTIGTKTICDDLVLYHMNVMTRVGLFEANNCQVVVHLQP